MRFAISLLLAGALCGVAAAQDHSAHNQDRPVTMMPGLGDMHHPVSTKNAEAQQFFDQGLRLIYAFNHDEAARSFQHAAELDPKLAIARDRGYAGIGDPSRSQPHGRGSLLHPRRGSLTESGEGS